MQVEKPFLDLNKYHFVRTIGDVRIYGAWCGPDKRPCLALLSRFQIIGKRTIPFVVHIDNAYLWSDEHADPAHIVEQSAKACECLGLDVRNPRNVVKISFLIQDHIGDLLAIPPMRSEKSEQRVLADLVMTDEHGKQKHAEIRDDT
ncbi:MAG: hypothetical protein KGZ69_08775 [Methylomonas sp.]|nr:hypothetical protein [Methylomonas sp.]